MRLSVVQCVSHQSVVVDGTVLRIQRSNAGVSSSLNPLYFSYEDFMKDLSEMRSKSVNKSKILEMPPEVEVFNMMDVLTSIDQDQWKLQRRS